MVNKSDIIKVLNLSKLYINENEIDDLVKDMENIINFANEIDNAEISDENFEDINNFSNVFNEDEVVKPLDRDLALKNANLTEDGFFKIKKFNNQGNAFYEK